MIVSFTEVLYFLLLCPEKTIECLLYVGTHESFVLCFVFFLLFIPWETPEGMENPSMSSFETSLYKKILTKEM